LWAWLVRFLPTEPFSGRCFGSVFIAHLLSPVFPASGVLAAVMAALAIALALPRRLLDLLKASWRSVDGPENSGDLLEKKERWSLR